MKKRGADLQAGDAIRVGDWTLHIRAIDHEDTNTAAATVEMAGLWHVDNDRLYDVIEEGKR